MLVSVTYALWLSGASSVAVAKVTVDSLGDVVHQESIPIKSE